MSTVGGRIIAGFAVSLLILAAVVTVSAWSQREHRSGIVKMQHDAATVSSLQDAKMNGAIGFALVQHYVISGDQTLVPLARSSEVRAMERLAEAHTLEEVERNEELLAGIGEVMAEAASMFDTLDEAIALRRSGDLPGARAALVAALSQALQLEVKHDRLAEMEQTEVAALGAEADRTGDLALRLLILSGATGAVLGLAVSAFIARSILRPLRALESAALAVRDGDLNVRVTPAGPRELAHLGESLNQMITKERERTEQLRLANEELRERNRQLLDARLQAATDALTGLANHRTFHERIRGSLNPHHRVGLIMLDIDDFKQVNDSLGHLAGDQVLRDLAATVTGLVRAENVYRYGGDEFAILLPEVNCHEAAAIGERLRRAVEKRLKARKVTISLGVACFPYTAKSGEELIYGADAAMYWAKSGGKNRVGEWHDLLNTQEGPAKPWYLSERRIKNSDVVTALTGALAAKDPQTSAHTQRCAWYALQLATELGLAPQERPVVRMAALLHDIGKLAIPDELLFKPSPLTDEEWEVMKGHPTAALRILGQVRAINDASPAILHHHEDFDGSGYPDGLAGRDIPIASSLSRTPSTP
ncbi:MAG: diguanylate cyclase [Chloroflexi bacterium]|nr:diguanylate cyclase [Chloroflexota bacterium]